MSLLWKIDSDRRTADDLRNGNENPDEFAIGEGSLVESQDDNENYS
jgi:hypothetical protein